MSRAVTLNDAVPTPRYDGVPWSRVRFEQSAEESGPWVAVATQALDPLDDDPADPRLRDLTVAGVSDAAEWLRLVFLDDADGEQPTNPVAVPPAQVVAWRPTVRDVAALLVTRTGRAVDDDDTSDLMGATFTDATSPTADQTERFIDYAVAEVASRVAVDVPDRHSDQARRVAAMWASVLAELSLVPDGSADDERSVAPTYRAAYEQRLADLVLRCRTQNTRLS